MGVLFAATALAQPFNSSYTYSRTINDNSEGHQLIVEGTQFNTIGVATQILEPGSTNKYDLLITHTEPDGTVIWSKSYGVFGRNEKIGALVESDDQSLFVLVGTAENAQGNEDLLVLGVEIATGNIAWEHVYGNAFSIERGTAILSTGNEQGYLVAGTTTNGPNGFQRAYLLRIDAQGGVIWEKRYDQTQGYQTLSQQTPLQIIRAVGGPVRPSFSYEGCFYDGKPHDYIVVGNYRDLTNPYINIDIFAFAFSGDDGAMQSPYYTYNLRQDKMSTRPKILAHNDEYYITFDSEDYLPGFHGQTAGFLKLNAQLFPLLGNHYFSMTNHRDFRTLGAFVNPNGQQLDIAIQLDDQITQSNYTASTGFFSVDLNGDVVNSNFLLHYNVGEEMGGEFFARKSNGYLIGGLGNHSSSATPSGGLFIYSTDFSGNSNNLCDGINFIDNVRGPLFCSSEVFTDNNFSVRMPISLDVTNETGDISNCLQGDFYQFRKAAVADEENAAAALADQISLFPNPLVNGGAVTLTWQDMATQPRSVEITNALGQAVARINLLSASTSGSERLDAKWFTPGLNIVMVKDDAGQIIFSERVILQ